jgi:hypothetical protein
MLACLIAASFCMSSSSCQAGQAQVFRFFKKLEVNPTPFTDGYAYWYGKGKFDGSQDVYDVEVILKATDKLANNPEPGTITPLKMTYIISRNGAEVFRDDFTGIADLNNKTFFLHNGTATPIDGKYLYPESHLPLGPVQMQGVIKSIWTLQPSKAARGPMVVHGVLTIPSSE